MIELKIRRLTRQVDDLDRIFYRSRENDDRFIYASMLEHKLDDFIRGAVIQLHTAIEDMLSDIVKDRLLGIRPRQLKRRALRSRRGQIADDLLRGTRPIGFAQKVNLASALGAISKSIQKKLFTINTLRNKCGHNWLLNVRIRRKKRPAQQKPPLLSYKGRSLHNVAVFADFVDEYSMVYVRLYARHNGLRV